jgi:tRNA1Val (adenine37-N6)-methyltransferase
MERNPEIPFTYEYSQPEDYRFSLDSVEMPWKVAQHLKTLIQEDDRIRKASPSDYLKNRMRWWKVMDLCAGCGVLGFELNFHLPQIRTIDFVEVQDVYSSHFEANLGKIKNEGEFRFINKNYESLIGAPDFAKKYDLILCNPPYFLPEQGKMSPSEFKNRCRFFLDSTFEKLMEVIDFCLGETGEAFVLVRDLDDHGMDLLTTLRDCLRGKMKCENLTIVRGTFLLRLYR